MFPAVRIDDATALTHEPTVVESQTSEFEQFDLNGNGILDFAELHTGKIQVHCAWIEYLLLRTILSGFAPIC